MAIGIDIDIPLIASSSPIRADPIWTTKQGLLAYLNEKELKTLLDKMVRRDDGTYHSLPPKVQTVQQNAQQQAQDAHNDVEGAEEMVDEEEEERGEEGIERGLAFSSFPSRCGCVRDPDLVYARQRGDMMSNAVARELESGVGRYWSRELEGADVDAAALLFGMSTTCALCACSV